MDINDDTKQEESVSPTMDKTTSVLFDLEMRIVMSCDNLNLAEKLLNELRELSKVRKLIRKDFQQFESLLFVTKEYFEVATCDMIDGLYESLGTKNGYETEEIESLHEGRNVSDET